MLQGLGMTSDFRSGWSMMTGRRPLEYDLLFIDQKKKTMYAENTSRAMLF